jgi:O-antigen/teichoic acid export membrane protein
MFICGALINIIVAWKYVPADLGVFNQVYAIYMVVSQFAIVGIHLSVLKYSAEYVDEDQETNLILFSGILLSVAFSIITCLLLWISSRFIGRIFQSPEIGISLVYSIPGLFFFSINKVILSHINGMSKIKEYSIFQTLRYVILIVCLVILVVLKSPVIFLPVIFSITEILLFVPLFLVIQLNIKSINQEKLKIWIIRHFSFGMRGFLSNVFLDLNTRVDILILGYLTNDKTVGIYSFAAVLVEGLFQFPMALRVNYAPVIITLINQGKKEELIRQIKKGGEFVFKMMALIGIISICLFPMGLAIMGKNSEYIQSWPPFVILIIALVLSSTYIPFSSIILQAGYPGKQTLLFFFQVFTNILLNFLLVRYFGAIGSAMATGISMLLLIPLLKHFAKKTIGIEI